MRGQHRKDQRSRTALYAASAAGLVAALVAALVTVSPVSAEEPTGNPQLEHALAQQAAYCTDLVDDALTTRQRNTRADLCAMWTREVADLTPAPSPTASPTSSPTPVPSPTSSPSPTASPTASPTTPAPTATTPSPTPTTPSPSPTTPPSGCALPLYPTPACTGVPQGWTPSTTVGSYTTQADGQVIDGWRVTGSISVVHQNVTIRNSEVYGRIYNQASGVAYNGLLIEDVTVGPPTGNNGEVNGSIGVCGYTARRVEIRNAPEGFRVGGYGYSGNRCGPVVIVDSYAKLVSTGGCDHGDGVQGFDEPPGTVIAHNTIDMRGVGCSTAPIYMGDPYGATVTDNLIMGGSYTLRLHADGSATNYPRVVGNRIVEGAWDYGPALVDACSTIGEWRANTVVRIDSGYAVTSTVRQLTTCPEATGVGSLP